MSAPSTRTARDILGRLRRLSNPHNIAGMARYGIRPAQPLGITVKELRLIAKETGTDHEVAEILWESGLHEARILASIIADPARVTKGGMERWLKGFDSWDLCDQVCANLFEKTPHAWDKAKIWAGRTKEFERRAGFTLIARLAVRDRESPDRRFEHLFPLIRKGSSDDRNFVRKAVSWALRQIGKRSLPLHRKAISVAKDLAGTTGPPSWVGRDALKDLDREAVFVRFRKKKSR